MLKPKKKITRQELKEDKLVKTTLQVKNYLEENSKQVTYAVLIIFVFVLVIIWYRYDSQKSSLAANEQLGMAQIEFTNGNYTKATSRLLQLIQNYESTPEAQQGMFLLANIYYQQSEYTQARDYFKQFIDAYSGSSILLASGYAGLAACYETENNYAEAARLYEKAADEAGKFTDADEYFYLAGICYKKAGDQVKAREQFEILTGEHADGLRAKDAETQLLLLQ
jgi:TolA-binding protein